MSFLQLVQISKRYLTNGSSILALRDLSLSVERGEFVVLLGPSGCGKTTLLQIVAGLEPASSGQVLLEGRPISPRSSRGGAERTLIFQQPSLFPWLTAEENVAFGLRLAGIGAAERLRAVHQALGRVGLAPEGGNRGLAEVGRLYPHELSGGMQQRVALARALVLDPQVLLMDEPLAAVDALLRSRLQREIRATCAGKTVLFATHSIREALILADRVVILSPQPGQVRREITLAGAAPRPPTLELARLEEEIEGEMVVADSARAQPHSSCPQT